jgi:hypothetical protein
MFRLFRSLLAAIATLFIAVHAPQAAAQSTRAHYIDVYGYFTTDAQFEAWAALRAGLEADFDDICGDTFCEGDWSNITPLRLRCSVQIGSGRIGHCTWSFAASNEEIDPHTGAIAVETQAWQCALPIAPHTTIDALLAALAVDAPLYASLPGSAMSIYDGLAACF